MSHAKPSRDEKLPKAPRNAVTDDEVSQVKGGTTSLTDPTKPTSLLKPISPRTIIPCI